MNTGTGIFFHFDELLLELVGHGTLVITRSNIYFYFSFNNQGYFIYIRYLDSSRDSPNLFGKSLEPKPLGADQIWPGPESAPRLRTYGAARKCGGFRNTALKQLVTIARHLA